MAEVSGIALGRRGAARIAQLLAAARTAALSYDHVASTLGSGSPAGLPDRSFTRAAAGSLDTAKATLRAWAPHQGIGRVVPADAPIEVGTTVLVVAPFGPVQMAVPDRIVGVVDEPDRFGFAYGTLEGHAEVGEELFLAEQVGPGQLRLTIRIHARPGSFLARLATPFVGILQRAATRRYLDAWTEAIERAG